MTRTLRSHGHGVATGRPHPPGRSTTHGCPCDCHTGRPCSVAGGCVHLHHACVIGRELLTADEYGRYACYRCTEHHRRLLREVELYLVELPAMVTPAARRTFERRSPGNVPGAPVDLDVLAALDPRTRSTADRDHDPHVDEAQPRRYLWGEIHSLCRMLAEERAEPDPGAAVWYLLVHADWAARQPWFDEHHENVRELHAELRRLARDSPAPAFATCSACGGSVFWVRDQEVVDATGTRRLDCGRCAGCGALFYGARLARLQRATAAPTDHPQAAR
jgi:hypothetical protein